MQNKIQIEPTKGRRSAPMQRRSSIIDDEDFESNRAGRLVDRDDDEDDALPFSEIEKRRRGQHRPKRKRIS